MTYAYRPRTRTIPGVAATVACPMLTEGVRTGTYNCVDDALSGIVVDPTPPPTTTDPPYGLSAKSPVVVAPAIIKLPFPSVPAAIGPANVVVAVPLNAIVPVAVIPATVKLPEIKAFPCTARVALGVEVPMPSVPKSPNIFAAESAPPESVKPFDEASPTVDTPPRKVEVAEASTVKAFETTSAVVEAMLVTVSTVAVAFVVVRLVMVEEDVFARSCPVTTRLVVVAYVVVAFRTYKLSMVEEADAAMFAVVMVPVAVTFATEVISPEMRRFPCTASRAEGVVVPMPSAPDEVMRMPSERSPLFKVENTNAPAPAP